MGVSWRFDWDLVEIEGKGMAISEIINHAWKTAALHGGFVWEKDCNGESWGSRGHTMEFFSGM